MTDVYRETDAVGLGPGITESPMQTRTPARWSEPVGEVLDHLLDADEPAPYTVIEGRGTPPLVLVCDHASRHLPRRLGDLGLTPDVFERHVAYDIGAAAVTRLMAEALDATAILSGYSRLVIDCNRAPGDPSSMPELSENVQVPGNLNLDEHQRKLREDSLFRPYHRAISCAVARHWRLAGVAPVLFSVHSFTPVYNGETRPWDAGILWNQDPRLAVPMIERLREETTLMIGDNEPYSGRELAYTINVHGGAAGLANAAIEIRQDLLADEAGIRAWADRLINALRGILGTTRSRAVEHY